MDEWPGASLRILPEGTAFAVPSGSLLRNALLGAGIPVRGSCGGAGTCGQCRVRVDGEWVLACAYTVEHDATVFVPVSSRVPSASGPTAFVSREAAVASPGARLALAVDIGTTTLSVSLVAAVGGTGTAGDRREPGTPHGLEAIATRSAFNPQVAFGDDVITRINFAQKTQSGLAELRRAVIDEINRQAVALLETSPGAEIVRAVISGNSTMLRILLGLDLEPVRKNALGDWAMKAHSSRAVALGLDLGGDPPVHTMPVVTGWVGGDVVAGILSTGMLESPRVRLLVDLGTNGEMVLGCRDWLVACSCSAGPAFEGGGVTWGMPATVGAIDAVRVDPRTMNAQCRVIGNVAPEGVCGSGLVSALQAMLLAGVIDRSGRFRKPEPGNSSEQAIDSFHLATSGWGEKIGIRDKDILTVMRAKAAVYAGIKTVEEELGARLESLSEVLVAGGFGSSIDIESAVAIGLLPDLPRSRFRVVGNSSLQGASLCARTPGLLSLAEEISRRVTHLDLVGHPRFLEHFVKAMFLPHTDLEEFPSQRGSA
jgi:uncharacterized 2Fe-2S/4Fe-4S cluster protein (DUF4445 family)